MREVQHKRATRRHVAVLAIVGVAGLSVMCISECSLHVRRDSDLDSKPLVSVSEEITSSFERSPTTTVMVTWMAFSLPTALSVKRIPSG